MSAQTKAILFKINLFKVDLPKKIKHALPKTDFFKSYTFKVLAALALVIAGLAVIAVSAFAGMTFTVNSIDDDVDDGGCQALPDGDCTLREALQQANTTANNPLGIPDVINFDITTGTTAVKTISPASALPDITDPVNVDGTTQPSFSGSPVIELNGANAGTSTSGLKITDRGAGSTVRGLVINRFKQSGISIVGGGGNKMEGNYIGTDATGTTDLGNSQYGIQIISAQSNVVGGSSSAARNVISGNDNQGVYITTSFVLGGPGAASNQVQGNYIGTNAAGNAKLGNSQSGVYLETALSTFVENNVISGNSINGLVISAGSGVFPANNNHVQDNYIGTDASGTKNLGNSSSGVLVSNAPGNFVRGNVVSGNGTSGNSNSHGVYISGSSARGNQVQGNYIGTNKDGARPAGAPDLGNVLNGVLVELASDNTVGGVGVSDRNVISDNNRNGVAITSGSSGTRVQGNHIGTDANGTTSLGNTLHGVDIQNSSGNFVGDTTPEARNVISGNSQSGVNIQSTGGTTSGNFVQGNYIGTDATGTAPLGNLGLNAIVINGASNNTVGGTTAGARNVISGNRSHGILISGSNISGSDPAASNNKVQGNYIGTNKDGARPAGAPDLGNNGIGLNVVSSANNTIGGTEPGAGNVISDNSVDGIRFQNSGTSGNRVQGNLIGTNAAGTDVLGNSQKGVNFNGNVSNNLVGGSTPEARNVISGNGGDGIFWDNVSGTGNATQGNYIGTDRSGTVDLGNGQYGIELNGAPDLLIGGTAPGAGNLVSGNNWSGIALRNEATKRTLVQGNYIGTNAAGNADVGNSQWGVYVEGATNNTIGGTEAGASNLVGFNKLDGVRVLGSTATGNAILRNSIFSNGGTSANNLGIDLDPDGTTANDSGDGDTGPNNLQNYPQLTEAARTGGTTTIEGTLNSTPSTVFTVQFFSSPERYPSSNGEGKKFLGEKTDVTTDASGNASFTFTSPDVSMGEFVTATATKMVSNKPSDTSEFSSALTVDGLFAVNSTDDQTDINTKDGVCNTGDTVGSQPECTLRAAIQQSNASTGFEKITVPAGTYALKRSGANEDQGATGDLDILQDVTIEGAGKDSTVIDGGKLDRVFHNSSRTVKISGMTVQNGSTGSGGAFYNSGTSANVTLDDVRFKLNEAASDGGAIYNDGTIRGTDSEFSNNKAHGSFGGAITQYNTGATLIFTRTSFDNNSSPRNGGAINMNGWLGLDRASFTNNTSGESGGGVLVFSGHGDIKNSTFAGNRAAVQGGGLYFSESWATPSEITNSTFSGNTVTSGGGGGSYLSAGSNSNAAVLTNVTIANNTSSGANTGGGINWVGGKPSLKNSIIANNSSRNCNSSLTSRGNNLDSGTSCGLNGTGDLSSTDPKLDDLRSNGGPTQTHALLSGSPAIDAGDGSGAPNVDQRGISRPQDGNGDGTATHDIGAYELDNVAPVAEDQTVEATEDTPELITLSATDSDNDSLTYKITTLPTNGTLYKGDSTDSANLTTENRINSAGTTLSGNQVTYVPNQDYNNASSDPDTFQFSANDANADSDEATLSINVAAVNDAPSIDLNGDATDGTSYDATFTEDGGPAPILDSASLAVTDVDSDTLTSATVKITNLKDGDAELLAADTSGTTTTIAAAYDPVTGELELSGEALKADYQQVLRTITYENTSQNPDTTDRSISLVVNDGTDDSETVTSTVTVEAVNDVPTVELSGDDTANEGDTKTYTYTVYDPDSSAPSITEGCGTNGTPTDTEATDSFDCAFSDGPTSSTVMVSAADDAGVIGSDSITVEIANVAPTATFEVPASVNESEMIEISLTNPRDPSTADTETGFEYAFDCGSGYDDFGATPSTSCPTTDDGTVAVKGKIRDKDGDETEYSAAVTVNNVAPSVTLAAENETDVDESKSTERIYNYAISDPGDDTIASAETSCGEKGQKAAGSDTNTDTSGSFECIFPDGPASSTVSVGATDSDGAASEADTQSVTINNVAPVAVDDDVSSANEGETAVVDVLANDTDAGDDTLMVTDSADGTHGTVSCTSEGSCTYTASDPDFFGTDTFSYTVSDDDGGTDTATVSVKITEVNDEPVAEDDEKTTPENTPLIFPSSDLTANDSEGADNEASQTLTVTKVSNPVHGTVGLAENGEVTFTPETDYNGPASFEYTVCDNGTTDGQADSKCSTHTATVNVTVSPVNSKPVVRDGTETMNEDGSPITIDFGALVSDTETSGADLTYNIIEPDSAKGTLTGTGSTRMFDSADDYNGTVTIPYTVTDRGDPDNCGTAGEGCAAAETSEEKTVTITVNPLNDAPVANDGTLATDEDTSNEVTLAATDVDGDSLTYAVVSSPEHGSLSGSGPNLTYTPDHDYAGSDSFTYEVRDGNGDTDTATVTITIAAVNDAPVAKEDSYTASDTELMVAAADGVLKNDTDIDNTALTAKRVTGPSNGTLSLNEDGSFTYKPNTGFSSTDSFTYKASDGKTESNTATVTITVKASNAAPTVKAQGPYEAKEGDSIPIKASGYDPEGGALTYAWDLDNDGSFDNASTQSATFDASNLDGPATKTIKVEVTDEKGATATDEATVNISNVAPAVTSVSAPSQALTGKNVSFSATTTDASKADTTTGFIYHWTVDGTSVDSSGSTLEHIFSSCGDHTVSVTAEDKDHGVSEARTSGVVGVYEAHFRQPLDEGVNNTVQKGRAIPVKITIGCGSSPLTGLNPAIQLLKGDKTPGTESSSDAIEMLASTVDTTGVMRPVDGGYIYNLKVPSDARENDKFTVSVRPFGDGNIDASMYVVLKIRK